MRGVINRSECLRKYKAVLAALINSRGQRNDLLKSVTHWGKAAGLTADDIIAHEEAAGVFGHRSDTRALWEGSIATVAPVFVTASLRSNTRTRLRLRPRTVAAVAPPAPPVPTDTVRRFIKAGSDVANFDALRILSPVEICADTDPLSRRVQCEQMLLAMFKRAEIMRLRKAKDDNRRGKPGENMRPLSDWLTGETHADEYGEIVRINPLTGTAGKTTSGKPSFDALTCIADFRHTLLEFDEMPLDDQCRFWAGFVRASPLAPNLVCLTYSGNKSIHAVLDIDCGKNAELYRGMKQEIAALFASDPDPAYRLDTQALSPDRCARLAGVKRKDTGKWQELLYVREAWREREWQRELNPPEAPQR